MGIGLGIAASGSLVPLLHLGLATTWLAPGALSLALTALAWLALSSLVKGAFSRAWSAWCSGACTNSSFTILDLLAPRPAQAKA